MENKINPKSGNDGAVSGNKDRGLKPVSSGTPMPEVKPPAKPEKPGGDNTANKK